MTERDLREEVMAELLACYGEGEHTDWPYLNDLRDLIVSMIEKHAVSETVGATSADYCDYCGWVEPDAHLGTCDRRGSNGTS